MNIVIAGVGGQGIILASKIIARCALEVGLSVKSSEVFGMAQRGGSVVSEIKIGKNIISPMFAKRDVDLLIGFEMIEGARNIYRLKEDGQAIINDCIRRPYSNDKSTYKIEDIRDHINKSTMNHVTLDINSIAEKMGNLKVTNTILIGTAVGLGLLPFQKDIAPHVLGRIIPEKLLGINIEAYNRGYEFSKGLVG